MIRLALVGYGAWGRNYVRAAEEAGNARVTQVVLRRHRDTGGIPVVERIDQLECDAAVVAIHPRQSPWVAQVLMRAGLPVMIEKPAALSVTDAKALEATERETGKLVLVAHQHLFAEGYEGLVKREIGPSDRVTAIWQGPGPMRDYSPLWDYGPHAVSALLGLERSVLVSDAGTVNGALYYADMLVGRTNAFIGVSNVAARKTARLEVSGPNRLLPLIYDGHAPAEPPLTRAVRAFATAVRIGMTTDWRFGASWATRVAKILEAIESKASRGSGRPGFPSFSGS